MTSFASPRWGWPKHETKNFSKKLGSKNAFS
jgi:hypothetical protein